MNPYKKIIELLEKNKVQYKAIEHEPVYTCEQAAKIRGVSPDSGAKALLIKSKEKYFLILLQGSKKLDSKKLRLQTDIKDFRFATPEEVVATMHCRIGACYPFGNIINLETFADTGLSQLEEINFNAGDHSKSIQMSWRDFDKIVCPKIIDIAK